MEYKPWPLLILAFAHFIEPISKVSFYSIYFSVSPIDVVTIEIVRGSARHIFEYFFLFPIAGIAIFAVKKWSFPVFLGVEIWTFASNLTYFNLLYQNEQILLLAFFIIFAIVNIFIVGYLLLPAVRIAYLDPGIRWWEAKPRYTINIKAQINNNDAGSIMNISESGVFLTSTTNLEINSTPALVFSIALPDYSKNKIELNLPTTVIHKFSIDNHEGYGIRFNKLSKDSKRLIKTLIKTLEKSNYSRRPPRRSINSLLQWLTTLTKTGEGLIPKIYNSPHKTGN